MTNRKNLSRSSIGCLILGLAALGSIFLFGLERGQLEQSCWDKPGRQYTTGICLG